MAARYTSYLRTSEQRGRPRLWIEARRLANAGFDKGARFRTEIDADSGDMRLVADPSGDRKVSGRKRGKAGHITPIIDICDDQVLAHQVRVRAIISEGCIWVSLHHEDAARIERERALEGLVEQGLPLREASVCSGIGVSTDALHQGLAGRRIDSRVSWIVEMDRRYAEIADQNVPAVRDEAQIFVARLEELEPALLDPVDVLSFSLPCDGHSRAGKSRHGISRAEDHPTSATTVFGLVSLLRATNPAVLVSENVMEAQSSATYELLIQELERRQYRVYEVTLDEAQAGSLERRTRWYFVALSEGIAPDNVDFADFVPHYPQAFRRLGNALEDVPADSRRWSKPKAYLEAKEERDAAAGKGFRRQLVDGEADAVGTVGKGYAKWRSTEPAIKAADGRERLLTPAEHARVKGIPENVVDGANDTLAHEGLGQSVLYNHMRGIAAAIGTLLRNRFEPVPDDVADDYTPRVDGAADAAAELIRAKRDETPAAEEKAGEPEDHVGVGAGL